jgi:hypothetical protein
MELLWAAKLFQSPAQCRFYQFHEKHGDDLAGRRHHYHVPVHVDGRKALYLKETHDNCPNDRIDIHEQQAKNGGQNE